MMDTILVQLFCKLFAGSVIAWGIYIILGLLRRLVISQIAKFPGSKFAAATFWYEFYFDGYLKGRYAFKIAEWHKKYGPIIRINPYEVHIRDAEFYSLLYSHSPPRDKHDYYLKPFDFALSSFATNDHFHHRRRRGAMNPFFSRAAVLKQETLIQDLVQRLCQRAKEMLNEKGILALSHGYTCLTTDLINSFVMDKNFNYLDETDWLPHWGQTLRDASEFASVMRQFTWMLPILKSFPVSWTEKLSPGLKLFFCLARRSRERIQEIMRKRTMSEDTADEKRIVGRNHTLIDQVMDSNLPDEEKSADRLEQEIRSAIAAGTETTSNTLTVITYHVLSNPAILQKLQKELRDLEPNPDAKIPLIKLEALPYLSSVILEGLRLGYGVSTRLQRKSREPIKYKDWIIPAGTIIGMCSIVQHHDENIFPNSHEFIPERWVDLAERKQLEKYMVSFSRGSRRCIGMNLALAELHVTIAAVFRKFDFELYNTTLDDIAANHDLFVPRPKNLKTMGVQVKNRQN